MLNHFAYLRKLSQLNVESVLDIGAHLGEFTLSMYELFPNAKYHMIEANSNCETSLQKINFATYDISLLSDVERDVCYYMNKNDLTSTGNSYYRELTDHFNDENVIETFVKAKTLDTLLPNMNFNFIKLDTQGSEIDIIKGGNDLLKSADYILMECSIVEYNKNSPKISDVIDYMISIGFENNIPIYDHIINGEVIQKDVLFTR